ncbi:DUF3047 domain-containing protein [Moritella sp. Urea-trap-13]|uniref:DUF3047 domain-containing protein n=1 Tax=Moritella sp. Urea-trap-13 TaxID=2058327 RepID=UPI000C31CCDF|nr:DUF3047 domain-containing protein [Moritella sp. Urea-trap-13]PKH06171.1 hypothetical protein CXF93_09575 [Moritella sp. Urea-trap-13]
MSTQSFLFVFLLIFSAATPAAVVDDISVARFSAKNLDGWEVKIFKDKTSYALVPQDGTFVLKADSRGSASGLGKEIKVNIKKYPYLTWSWKISNRLGPMNERKKSGDDYAARIYIIVSGGLFFWNTKALNYVWSSNLRKGTSWPNAFAGSNAQMYAVRSFDDQLDTWYEEKRNVYEDLKQMFGTEIKYIDAVALMTDTDNGSGNAVAYYGDISFTQK